MATLPRETPQSYAPARQCSATCRKTDQDILGNAKMGVAPSNYDFFRSMAHGLAHQHFCSYEEVKKWIDSWIASKDASFFRDGIRHLPERWRRVIQFREN